MKMKSKLSILVAILCVFECRFAFSQSNRPEKAVRFRMLAWSKPVGGLLFESEGKTQSVDVIVPNARTKAYSFTGAGDLVFFEVTTGPDGKELRVPLLTVPYEQLGENILILVLGYSPPYTAKVMDESNSGFPPGSYRFVNFTKLTIKVALVAKDAEIETIAPQSQGLVVPKKFKSGDVFTLRIVNETTEGGAKYHWIYSNRWMYGDRERIMAFINHDDSELNDGFSVKCFTEDVPAPTQSRAQPSNTKPGRPQ